MNPVILNSIGGILQLASGLVPGGSAAPLVISLVEEAIKEEPAIESALRSIFSKPDPTATDWKAERDALIALPEPTVEDPPVP